MATVNTHSHMWRLQSTETPKMCFSTRLFQDWHKQTNPQLQTSNRQTTKQKPNSMPNSFKSKLFISWLTQLCQLKKTFNNSGFPSYDLRRAENEITILLVKIHCEVEQFPQEKAFWRWIRFMFTYRNWSHVLICSICPKFGVQNTYSKNMIYYDLLIYSVCIEKWKLLSSASSARNMWKTGEKHQGFNNSLQDVVEIETSTPLEATSSISHLRGKSFSQPLKGIC